MVREKTTYMPELPEVENFKRYAEAHALNKTIADVDIRVSKVVKASEHDLHGALVRHKLTETARVGKYLMLKSGAPSWLVIHFGMTGKLVFSEEGQPTQHSILTLTFGNHSTFTFDCPRKFGKVYLADSVQQFCKEQKLGKDALAMTGAEYRELLKGKKGQVKSILTDQHAISGIGNVYADEILFQSRIHPKTLVTALSDKEVEILYKNTGKVLREMIKHIENKTSVPDDWLRGHRSEGADCPRGNGTIRQIKISGRSTYFCTGCQKEIS